MRVSLIIVLFFSLTVNSQEELIISKNVSVKKKGVNANNNSIYSQFFPTKEGILSINFFNDKESKFEFQLLTGNNFSESSLKTEYINKKLSKGDEYESEGFIIVGENLSYFYSTYTKKSNQIKLFSQLVNLQVGGFDGEPVELLSLNEQLYCSLNDLFSISTNDEFICILSKNMNYFKNAGSALKFNTTVFNIDLNKLWSNEIILPESEMNTIYQGSILDKKGNAYIVLQKQEAKPFFNENTPKKIKNSIIKITADSKIEISIDLGDYLCDDIFIQDLNNGEIICTGFYRYPENNFTYDGQFTCFINLLNEVTEIQYTEFSDQFIDQDYAVSEMNNSTAPNIKSNNIKGLSNIKGASFDKLDDGTILITSQINYTSTSTYKDANNQNVSVITYHYNDIILSKVNTDGTIAWLKKIPKRSENFYTLRNNSFITGNYLYYFFIDNHLNGTLKENESIQVNKQDAFICYKIDIADATHDYLTLSNINEIDGVSIKKLKENYYKIQSVMLNDNSILFKFPADKKSDLLFQVNIEQD